jgi:hypothetical protein
LSDDPSIVAAALSAAGDPPGGLGGVFGGAFSLGGVFGGAFSVGGVVTGAAGFDGSAARREGSADFVGGAGSFSQPGSAVAAPTARQMGMTVIIRFIFLTPHKRLAGPVRSPVRAFLGL